MQPNFANNCQQGREIFKLNEKKTKKSRVGISKIKSNEANGAAMGVHLFFTFALPTTYAKTKTIYN